MGTCGLHNVTGEVVGVGGREKGGRVRNDTSLPSVELG